MEQDVFFKKMPRSVMQSNWFYDRSFSKKSPRVRAYHLLEEHKYDQIPTGSNDGMPENFIRTTRFARRTIAPGRLKGFLQAPWKCTLPYCETHLVEAIDQVKEARVKWT